jgi:hypothetical protein
MTYAKERRIYGKDLKRHQSRFVIELDDEHIKEIDKVGFKHMTETEEAEYKSDFFNDLLSSIDD